MRKPSSAFTLIELLVVIAIIAVLAGLSFGIFGSVGRTRDRTAGAHNMRQVGLAFMLYAGEHDYVIPGRVTDRDFTTARWPAVLAGYATGTHDENTDYVKDLRIYNAPGYSKIDLSRSDLASFFTSNNPNNTSWTMNGYNDLGAKTTVTEIRTTRFSSASQTILLGMHEIGKNHFYMDFDDGDNKTVLELRAYGEGASAGSNYTFADGSVRFLTEEEYEKPAPTGQGIYGDWLWLADKTNPAPP